VKAKTNTIPFYKLHEQVMQLAPSVKEQLAIDLRNSYSIFNIHDNVKSCPYCNSGHVIKNGTRAGFHKYICRKCKKNFTFRSKSTLKGIHNINAWNLFVEDFLSLNLTPVRQLKKKIGVSEQTIFSWRHRLLASLENMEVKFGEEPAEFDELYFLISRKGRQEMNIPDKSAYKRWRKGQIGDTDYWVKLFMLFGRITRTMELRKSHMGRTDVTDLGKYFGPDKLSGTTIYSDRHTSYKPFFEEHGIKHETFKASHHRSWENREVHVQNINTYARDFKDFVNKRLKGVSTKYLEHYAKWFQFHHTVKIMVENQIRSGDKVRFNITDRVCQQLAIDKIGLEKYRRLEYDFQQFLKDNNRTDYGICKNHYFAVKSSIMEDKKTWEPPSYEALNADLRKGIIPTKDLLMYYQEFTIEEGFPGRAGQDLFKKAKKLYSCPTWARTRTLLLQRETCCQLHHRTIDHYFSIRERKDKIFYAYPFGKRSAKIKIAGLYSLSRAGYIGLPLSLRPVFGIAASL
jgi:transposase-like protein